MFLLCVHIDRNTLLWWWHQNPCGSARPRCPVFVITCSLVFLQWGVYWCFSKWWITQMKQQGKAWMVIWAMGNLYINGIWCLSWWVFSVRFDSMALYRPNWNFWMGWYITLLCWLLSVLIVVENRWHLGWVLIPNRISIH